MKWIKYKIVCNENENILLDKKLGYNDANLAIAQKEAHNGEYEIFEDNKSYDDKPVTEEKETVNIVVENHADYSFIGVVSLTMKGALANAHGFITFGASTPSIRIEGFSALDGDDITAAAANETWEFSAYPHNNGSYIIWKNWSAD